MLVMAPFYTATDLTLSVELLGDASGDGVVNGIDFAIWADHFGSSEPSYNDGDFSRDAVVNGIDFAIWADKFGTVVMGPESGPAAVPEPSTLALLCFAVVSFVASRLLFRDPVRRRKNPPPDSPILASSPARKVIVQTGRSRACCRVG